MQRKPSRRLTWAERKARARCRCVVLVSGAALDRAVARLTRNGEKSRARSLARLLIERTPGRVENETKSTVTLRFTGSVYPYAVPSAAVKTVNVRKHRRTA